MNTIEYYNENARRFIDRTVSVDFEQIQNAFLELLPVNAYILDFGCGSGRDTKYFFEQGYRVDAIDDSQELCRLASEYKPLNLCQISVFYNVKENPQECLKNLAKSGEIWRRKV